MIFKFVFIMELSVVFAMNFTCRDLLTIWNEPVAPGLGGDHHAVLGLGLLEHHREGGPVNNLAKTSPMGSLVHHNILILSGLFEFPARSASLARDENPSLVSGLLFGRWWDDNLALHKAVLTHDSRSKDIAAVCPTDFSSWQEVSFSGVGIDYHLAVQESEP